jgi:DNA-binding FrmR family transcriptional regulator
MEKQNGRTRTAGRAGRKQRKAVAVDPEIKAANLARLRRIEGQVRGIHKMVEEDRYCADVLGQLSAIHEALRAVGRELIRNHLRHCATDAIQAGGAPAESMYDELVDLFHKNAR